jgi:hypothetical protein
MVLPSYKEPRPQDMHSSSLIIDSHLTLGSNVEVLVCDLAQRKVHNILSLERILQYWKDRGFVNILC